jgi:hypothetical protein
MAVVYASLVSQDTHRNRQPSCDRFIPPATSGLKAKKLAPRQPICQESLMFPRTVLVASIAAAAMSIAAVAQDNTPPASRAEVKAETKAAEKAGKLTPAGEGAAPTEKATTKSTKTRAQRKAETMQARKSGDLAPAGEAEDAKEDKESQSMHSTKTRAQRKAEERADAKAGKLIPAGEGPGAPTK